MKNLCKIALLSMCIFLIALSVVHAESIKDNTYRVIIWTPISSLLNPRWVDQFEFDAGDVFRAYTQNASTLTGTWIETELIETNLTGVDTDQFRYAFAMTWFQAFVDEAEETTTTTTTPEPEPELLPQMFITPQSVKYEIFLQGMAYTWTIVLNRDGIPDTADDQTFEISFMTGRGAYLGADSAFWGSAGITGGGGGGGGGDATFGSISPEEGTQEAILSVEIGGTNTTFQDDGPVEIAFIPNNDDLTISGKNTVDNETIEFTLEIDTNAEIGTRTVVVTYDDGNQSVTGDNVFTVNSK